MGFNTLARTQGSGAHTQHLEAYRERWPTLRDMKVPQLPQQTLQAEHRGLQERACLSDRLCRKEISRCPGSLRGPGDAPPTRQE